MAIRLNLEKFCELQRSAGLNETELATAMNLDRTQVYRVKKGLNAPGEDFIAGALRAFPKAKFNDLFFMDEVLRGVHNDHAATLGPTGTE